MNKRTVINHLDPRAGLWLLLMANIGMFCQKKSEQGSMLSEAVKNLVSLESESF